MQKIISSILLLAMCSSIATAQNSLSGKALAQGSWQLGLSSDYTTHTSIIAIASGPRTAASPPYTSQGLAQIGINATGGYMLLPHLLVAADIHYNWQPKQIELDTATATHLNVGLLMRYYLPIGNSIAIYPEAAVGYADTHLNLVRSYKTLSEYGYYRKNTMTLTGTETAFGLGLLAFVSKHIAIDVAARYHFANEKGNNHFYLGNSQYADEGDAAATYSRSGIGFRLGVQAFLFR
jgi:hypothetical protein